VSGPVVVVFDYGSGNLRSAQRALARAGAQVSVTADRAAVMAADGLVVPGVGAFAACMAGLHAVDGPALLDAVLAAGKPVLGICVGMQVLFETGVEHGTSTAGFGRWPGVVERLDAPVLPHIGWNTVRPAPGSALFRGVEDQRFYFVHSYAALDWVRDGPDAGGAAVTWSEHGTAFVAAVEDGLLSATQFHPEKSGDAGAVLLANWMEGLR